MRRIEKHISDLLFIHDCVIVPGFGGFVTNTIPASINRDTGVLAPPSKEIGFNRTLKHNDGLLANHIVSQENITYSNASSLIKEFVENLNRELFTNNKYLINEIGFLSEGKNGEILFESHSTQNFLTDSFGLSSIHVSPLANSLTSVQREIKAPRRSFTLKYSRQIAAGLLLATGLFLFSPELEMGEIENTDQANIAAVFSTSSKSYQEIKAINKVQSTTENNLKTTQPKQAIIQSPTPQYYLIAASFNTEVPAKQMVKKLKQQGYNQAAVIRTNNSNRYRVSLYSFVNKSAAYQVLEDYRQKPAFKTVWLHKIRS